MSARFTLSLALCLFALSVATLGQTRKTPARKAPAPAKAPPLTRVAAELDCPSPLGLGIKSAREFCDVLTGRDPKAGIIITIPPHRGPVMLTFDLHNRHTYSEELITKKTAFRDYTATIGVLALDNTLVDRAVIQSQFRRPADLVDRIGGGAGPGGMKAVAPTGTESIAMELPEDIGEQVAILGEKLKVVQDDGKADTFLAPGRPIATISNVMIEYRPGPPPRKTPPKKP